MEQLLISHCNRKLNILLRLSLPLFPIVLTLYAIPSLISNDPRSMSHIRRTLLVSIDILLTAFSANAVVLFSLLQDKGYKKSKFKHVLEGFNTHRPNNILRASYVSGSTEIPTVELYDAGNLLQGSKVNDNVESHCDPTNKQLINKTNHEITSLRDTILDLNNEEKGIPIINYTHKTEQLGVHGFQYGVDSGANQHVQRNEEFDQITIITKDEIRHWRGHTRNINNSNNLCDKENQILHPGPVHFGENRQPRLDEVHIEE